MRERERERGEREREREIESTFLNLQMFYKIYEEKREEYFCVPKLLKLISQRLCYLIR